jgi:peptide/nickel transport system substrate-binding protein
VLLDWWGGWHDVGERATRWLSTGQPAVDCPLPSGVGSVATHIRGRLIAIDLQLLGPVEATLDGRPVPLGATKQRALLAMLALDANATVSVDRLVDGLWGDDPPATAAKMVQLYVSQLRRLLAGADAAILTHGRGYELRVGEDAVDAGRFERLVERAGHADGTADDARTALALWHGAALADVAAEPFAAAEVRRLDELWLTAAELVVEADLAAGRDADALSRLDRLIDAQPLRERLHARRMLALYRTGRQAEALEAFVTARGRLVEEVGVEPGAELRELHERILRQDPTLRLGPPANGDRRDKDEPLGPRSDPASATVVRGPPTPTPALVRVRGIHGRRYVVAAGAAILIAVAIFAVTRLTGSDPPGRIDAGSVGVIDPAAGAITAQYRVASEAGAVAAGAAGTVWVAGPREGTVSRIYADREQVGTIDVETAPVALAFGARSVWVGREDGLIARIDPATNRIVQRIPVGNGLRAIAVGHGAVWAATSLDGEVVRIDQRSGLVTRRIAVGGQPVALAVSASGVWVAAEESGTLVRIDPGAGDVVHSIPVGNGPSAVAVGFGAVWAANRQDGTVSRIDPATDHVTDLVVGVGEPVSLTVARDALWVADAAGALRRIDPRTRRVTRTVRTGGSPVALATVGGEIWAPATAAPAAHRGGTLRVGVRAIDMDPGRGGYNPDSFAAIELAYDGLLDFRRAAGAAGARLVGGLAGAVPQPADGGRRYVFRLRAGLRYSDGTPVRASDVGPSIERALVITRGDAGLPPLFDAIRGAVDCRTAHRTCDLADGIIADDRTGTVTFRLRRPDPELLRKLTLPLVSVVPASTPRRPQGARAIPGTGPYRVARVVPGRRAVLARNPRFRPRPAEGRPDGFADRVELTMGTERAHVAAAERGQLDVAPLFETATAARLAALRARFGTRLRSGSFALMEFAWLNVRAAPFDDPRVRHALALAVDRGRVADLTGGREAGSPTCQLLPPGLPGYRPTCPFTVARSPAGVWVAPDRAEAERLVAASGARGIRVEVWTYAQRRELGRYIAGVLSDLGFRARLRVFAEGEQLIAAVFDPREHAQVGIMGWVADFPEPAGFMRALVACDGGLNLSHFCEPGIDAAIDRAAGSRAGAVWARVERRIAGSAPLVPLVTHRVVVLTSGRAGNIQIHPLNGVLLEQIWVR